MKDKHIKTIKAAIFEAKRFIGKANDCIERYESDPSDNCFVYPCKEAAAMKRSSMDLTRALVEIRKPS